MLKYTCFSLSMELKYTCFSLSMLLKYTCFSLSRVLKLVLKYIQCVQLNKLTFWNPLYLLE